MHNLNFLLLFAVLWTHVLCSERRNLGDLEQALADKGDSYKSRIARQWTVSEIHVHVLEFLGKEHIFQLLPQ